MYVAVKGGGKAIENAHRLLDEVRRGDPSLPELSVPQIREQLSLAVDRVMAEGSLYDRDLAALAVKQARGDLIEAIFLLRAYRTTLPRLAVSQPVDTGAMRIKRRISAAFKDLPGGQVLGPTFDYTHRLLDFSLLEDNGRPPAAATDPEGLDPVPRVTDVLKGEGIIEDVDKDADAPVGDITRQPLNLPAGRDLRLQSLARGDEGFVLSLGYSVERGFGSSGSHPFAGEIRLGPVAVSIVPEELGFAVEFAEIELTECQMISKYTGNKETPPQFMTGYGLAFGLQERKAMSMAIVDRALRCGELGEEVASPAQDEEFVLMHCDNVEATGFVEHLKLPHHVDFQGELEIVRRLRQERAARAARADQGDQDTKADQEYAACEERPS